MVDATNSEQDFESLLFEAAPVQETETEEAPVEEQTGPVDEPVAEEAAVEQEPETETVEAEADEAGEAEPVEAAQTTENNDETPEEPLYSVKVDGEPRDVTLDELLRGYSGQEYVQEGMKKAAALKKEAENAYEVLQGEVKALQSLRHRMESGETIAKPTPPDPQAFQNDPLGYMEAKMEYDGKLEAYNDDMSRLDKLGEAEKVRMGKAHQAELERQKQILHKRIPDLADPEKAPALQKRMVAAGMNYYGFSERDMLGQVDARQVSVLHDAMRYRELQAAGQSVKPNKPKPAIKPGAARTEVNTKTKQRAKAKARMQKSGDMQSVIDFLTS